MGNRRGSRAGTREKMIKKVEALGLPCAICGDPIDYSIKDMNNPEHFELDEVIPYSMGGATDTWENTQPTHRLCNLLKGNKLDFFLNGLDEAYAKYKGSKYAEYRDARLARVVGNTEKEPKITFFGSNYG